MLVGCRTTRRGAPALLAGHLQTTLLASCQFSQLKMRRGGRVLDDGKEKTQNELRFLSPSFLLLGRTKTVNKILACRRWAQFCQSNLSFHIVVTTDDYWRAVTTSADRAAVSERRFARRNRGPRLLFLYDTQTAVTKPKKLAYVSFTKRRM